MHKSNWFEHQLCVLTQNLPEVIHDSQSTALKKSRFIKDAPQILDKCSTHLFFGQVVEICLLVSLLYFPKCFSNNSSAFVQPSGVSTTDFDLLIGFST